ncbi:MAG: MFS transporter [Elusimicrobia bacterium]|nr:MFS transporter [Elusimicrobiota bacterium]
MNSNIFRSFRHRNFRLFFIGQIISVTGSWIQITAMPWFVYRITGSALLLGFVGFLSQIFMLVVSPFAGVVVDHYNRRKLIIITQILAMFQALILAVLAISGKIQVWHIIILAAFLGLVYAFDMPARQAYLVEMVGKSDLMNAVALNSSIVNSGRLIGPALAGILIAAVGEGFCFLINGISFLGVIMALFLMTDTGAFIIDKKASFSEKFRLGIKYIHKSKNLFWIMIMVSVTALVTAFPAVLMPVFVKDIFNLDASGLGLFMSFMGIGALIGSVKIASKKNSENLERYIVNAVLGIGFCVVVFAVSTNIFITLFSLVLLGYFTFTQFALSNTLIQIIIPDEMRGRVMGFFIMALLGFMPLGSLAAGYFTHKLTAPMTVLISGIIGIISALVLRNKIINTHRDL